MYVNQQPPFLNLNSGEKGYQASLESFRAPRFQLLPEMRRRLQLARRGGGGRHTEVETEVAEVDANVLWG